MRILCLIPDLRFGGAERNMCYLIDHLAKAHDVTLLTWEKEGAPSPYRLPVTVRRLQADRLGDGWQRPFRIASRFPVVRRTVHASHPDVVISFLDMMNVTAVLACLGTRTPVIVSQRHDPAHDNLRQFKATLRDRSYGLADAVVVQTRRVAEYFPAALQSRIRIVANPVPPAAAVAAPDRPDLDGRFRLVGIGRLEHQKDHRRLIDAFAMVADRQPLWDVAIIGEGQERAALEARVRATGVTGRVTLPGTTPDIAGVLAGAHLMAFPSIYEGFPNALAEGLAAGLPAVGNVGVSGVEDLIVDGSTGLLVDPASGADGFADALFRLMADAPLRSRMGDAARSHVRQWSPERIFGAWDELLAEVAGRDPRHRRNG